MCKLLCDRPILQNNVIVYYHSGKLSRGHLDDTGVVSLGDAEVLLVQIHQLHLVVGDLLLVGGLEHEGDVVGLVLGLHGDDVIISCASEQTFYNFQYEFYT